MVAVRKFNFKGSFSAYWYVIANNEMTEAAYKESLYLSSKDHRESVCDSDYADISMLSSSEQYHDHVSDTLAIDEVIDFLNNPKNKISQRDVAIFLYYISSCSYQQTANNFGTSYAYVYEKVRKIRKKITNILYKSKD